MFELNFISVSWVDLLMLFLVLSVRSSFGYLLAGFALSGETIRRWLLVPAALLVLCPLVPMLSRAGFWELLVVIVPMVGVGLLLGSLVMKLRGGKYQVMLVPGLCSLGLGFAGLVLCLLLDAIF